MNVLWPGSIALLGIIPILIGVYIWLRRRRRVAVRFSSLSLVRDALPKQSWIRQHLPFIAFVTALTSLIIAAARPVAIVSVPSGQATIILAMDVSRSMCSTDIEPTRLQAAKDAAMTFVDSQGAHTQIGIVAFAGFAEVVQAPTTDQELLADAIQSLTTGRRTAIGNGILKALEVLAEIDKGVAPVNSDPSSGIVVTPVPKGAYAPDIIVLLTDGANNSGIEPADAAQMAADRGVKVYTIGFGTERGAPNPNCGQFQGSEPFSGGQGFGGGGPGFRRGIDEVTLKLVASLTGAEYYSAESAGELQNVFRNLPTYLIMKHEVTEISVGFAALGALMAITAVMLGILWRPLPG